MLDAFELLRIRIGGRPFSLQLRGITGPVLPHLRSICVHRARIGIRRRGSGDSASKILGAVAGIGSLAVTHVLLRDVARSRRALMLTGVCALELLTFTHYSYWTRPDSLELLGVAAAMALATSRWTYLTAGLMGVPSGVVWALKFTSVLYTLPAFALFERRAGLPV
jgi:hypothetical protein